VQSIFFLRKSRMFNKSRYSRSRQTTRVAFYLSLLVNIIIILGVFTLFYKILFKLALLWWPFYVLLGSFFLGSFLRTQIFSKLITWTKNAFKR
jgi:H+/Cl- antiporter ClcA